LMTFIQRFTKKKIRTTIIHKNKPITFNGNGIQQLA